MDHTTHPERPAADVSAEPAAGILTDLRVAASRVVLATVVGLLFWAVACALLGMKVTTIRSGSMEPSIMTGDVVAASHLAFSDVEPGQVLTVHNPAEPGGYLTHRVVAIDTQGRLVTRGDANGVTDSSHVPAGDVWLGRLRVPWIGYPVVWARQHDWAALGLAAVGLALVVRGSIATPVLVRSVDDADGGGGGRSRRLNVLRTRRREQIAVATVAGGVLVTLVALQVAGSSAAAFTAQSRSATSTWSAAAAPVLGAYGDAVMASQPYLWFRMDDRSGCTTLHDSSGFGHDSYYVGTPTCSLAGALPNQVANDTATGFNGTAAVASDRTYPSINAMTFEAFVKFDDWSHLGNPNTVAEFVAPTGWRDRLYVLNSNVIYDSGTSGPQYLQGNIGGDAKWHYVGISMNGGTVNVQVDNFTWVSGSGFTRGVDSLARFVLGTHNPPYANTRALGTDNFYGQMDEVALYTRALTPAELNAHYQASLK